MRVELKLHHVNSDEFILNYIERRLSFGFSRFGDRIGTVTTRIGESEDAHSPGVTCRMIADLHPFGTVMTEATDADVYTAIDRCAGRLARRCESKCARPRTDNRTTIRIPRSA